MRLPNPRAAFSTCWMRWMFEAKQATNTRPRAASNASSSAAPTSASDSDEPGRSAFVESDRSSARPAAERLDAREVEAGPATGRGSILKSPEWTIVPCGVVNARPHASGMEWVTA